MFAWWADEWMCAGHACVSVCLSLSPVYLVECVVRKRRPTCTVIPRASWSTYGAQGDPWLARWPGCHSTHWGDCWREFSLLIFHSLPYFFYPCLLSFSFSFPSSLTYCTCFGILKILVFYSHIVSVVTVISWQIQRQIWIRQQLFLSLMKFTIKKRSPIKIPVAVVVSCISMVNPLLVIHINVHTLSFYYIRMRL